MPSYHGEASVLGNLANVYSDREDFAAAVVEQMLSKAQPNKQHGHLKPRRTFTREFKLEAIKLVIEQRRNFAEAAANLGIAESLLRKWKKDLDAQGDQAFPGKGHLPTLEEELRRRRAENKCNDWLAANRAPPASHTFNSF